MNRSRWILVLVAVLCGSGCSENPTDGAPGQAGTLALRLRTPNADDGAIAFEVSGPAIDSVLAGDASLRLFTRRVGDSTVVGAVVGELAEGTVVQLHVPDISTAARYSARVLEVADRQDEVRASLTGYSLTVGP